MMPIISIIIDTYNYASFIERAIDSALSQTIAPNLFEVIVVDDGSSDDTPQRVSLYGDRIIYLRKENGGQASAFNAGIAQAKGKYVAFLDADDYFYPSKLAEVLKVFNSDETIGVVYNKFDMVDDNDAMISQNMPLCLLSGDIINRIAMGYVIGSPSSGISIKRDLGLRVPIPEAQFRISADYFLLNIMPIMAKVGVVETSEHAYRIHSSNLYMKKNNSEQLRIHAMQNYSIYAQAEELGYPFFRALHDFSHAPDATTITGRIRIFWSGMSWLCSSTTDIKLRSRTFLKLVTRFFLAESVYTRFQHHRQTL